MGTLGKIFFPLANVLDAEVEIEGVYFDPSRPESNRSSLKMVASE